VTVALDGNGSVPRQRTTLPTPPQLREQTEWIAKEHTPCHNHFRMRWPFGGSRIHPGNIPSQHLPENVHSTRLSRVRLTSPHTPCSTPTHPLGHCVHGWVPIPQNATRTGPMEAPPRLWRGGPHTQRTHERTPLHSPETPSTPPPTPSKSNRGGRGSWPIATKHADIGSSCATAHTRFCPGINQRRRIPATEVTHRILAWHGFSFLLRLLQRHSCTTRLLILLVPNHSCKR
jgi:hypothetical protein